MEKNGIKRKCNCCGEYFYIDNNNVDEAIYYDKKTYHSNCFISLCNKRSNSKRKDISEKWKSILNNLSFIKQESKKCLEIAITKEMVFVFIREHYDVTIISNLTLQKIANIYNGTFRGMEIGIPPEHLLDMWNKKIDMLNELYEANKTRGKKMTSEQRINYDLSVLINKYDSYLKWLEKQKILEVELEKESISEEKLICNNVVPVKNNSDYDCLDDISDLVDDIFG